MEELRISRLENYVNVHFLNARYHENQFWNFFFHISQDPSDRTSEVMSTRFQCRITKKQTLCLNKNLRVKDNEHYSSQAYESRHSIVVWRKRSTSKTLINKIKASIITGTKGVCIVVP